MAFLATYRGYHIPALSNYRRLLRAPTIVIGSTFDSLPNLPHLSLPHNQFPSELLLVVTGSLWSMSDTLEMTFTQELNSYVSLFTPVIFCTILPTSPLTLSRGSASPTIERTIIKIMRSIGRHGVRNAAGRGHHGIMISRHGALTTLTGPSMCGSTLGKTMGKDLEYFWRT